MRRHPVRFDLKVAANDDHYGTVFESRSRGAARAVPKPSRPARRAPRAPSKGKTPAPVPQVVPVEVPADEPWTDVVWLDEDEPRYTRGAFELVGLEVLPWTAPQTPPVPGSASAPAAPSVDVERVIEWNPGVRLDPSLGLIALGTVIHAAIGYSIAYGLHVMDQPLPVAVGLGVFVPVSLLALHSGFGQKTPVPRWTVVVAFTAFGLYCSTLTWRTKLGGADATDAALAHHAALEATLYRPRVLTAESADADADGAEAKCNTEKSPEMGGYKSRARAKCDAAADLRVEADKAERARAALAPYFGDIKALTALQLYANDRDAVGVAGEPTVAAPDRGAYYTQPFLVPLYRGMEAEPETLGGLALSLLVELMGAALLYMGHRQK